MWRHALLLSLAAILVDTGAAHANSPCRSDFWSLASSQFGRDVPAGCPIEVAVPQRSFGGAYEIIVGGASVPFTSTELARWPIDRTVMRCGGEACGRLVSEDVEVAVMRFEPTTPLGERTRLTIGEVGSPGPLSLTISAAGPCVGLQPWTSELCGEANCMETCEDDGGCAVAPPKTRSGTDGAAPILLALAVLGAVARRRRVS